MSLIPHIHIQHDPTLISSLHSYNPSKPRLHARRRTTHTIQAPSLRRLCLRTRPTAPPTRRLARQQRRGRRRCGTIGIGTRDGGRAKSINISTTINSWKGKTCTYVSMRQRG